MRELTGPKRGDDPVSRLADGVEVFTFPELDRSGLGSAAPTIPERIEQRVIVRRGIADHQLVEMMLDRAVNGSAQCQTRRGEVLVQPFDVTGGSKTVCTTSWMSLLQKTPAGFAAATPPEISASLRRMALNILQRDTTVKDNIRGKRLRAGWDEDVLEQIWTAFSAV